MSYRKELDTKAKKENKIKIQNVIEKEKVDPINKNFNQLNEVREEETKEEKKLRKKIVQEEKKEKKNTEERVKMCF